jgi:hypothetical protein
MMYYNQNFLFFLDRFYSRRYLALSFSFPGSPAD